MPSLRSSSASTARIFSTRSRSRTTWTVVGSTAPSAASFHKLVDLSIQPDRLLGLATPTARHQQGMRLSDDLVDMVPRTVALGSDAFGDTARLKRCGPAATSAGVARAMLNAWPHGRANQHRLVAGFVEGPQRQVAGVDHDDAEGADPDAECMAQVGAARGADAAVTRAGQELVNVDAERSVDDLALSGADVLEQLPVIGR
jgi:hypothetical protein